MFTHVMVGASDLQRSKQFYDQVDAFHAAGIANGGTAIEDPPGARPSGISVRFHEFPASRAVHWRGRMIDVRANRLS